MPRANGLREARADAGKFAQDLTGLPEIETGREMLDEVKDVAFRIALRVPPSSALVADDQDLAVFPPIFKAVRGALPSIKPPWRRQAFQQGGAMDRCAQLLYFWVIRSMFWLPLADRSVWRRASPLRHFPAGAFPQPRGGPAARAR